MSEEIICLVNCIFGFVDVDVKWFGILEEIDECVFVFYMNVVFYEY